MKRLLALTFVVVFAFGCTSKKGSTNPVLAKGAGVKITKEYFNERINRLPEWAMGRFRTEEGKREFLNELVKEELLYREAKKQGLSKDKEVQAKLEEFQRMTLITTLLKKEIEEKAKVDDKEVKEFYDKNPAEFKAGLEVRAKHILVDSESEAKNILKRIQKGEKFSELAKKYSKDKGSAQNGGDLGFFSSGKMIPEFENAAFSLKVGQVSNPVKTQFGYHIIQVTDRKEGSLYDFEGVEESIRKRLTIDKQRNLFTSYVENLEKKAKIKINEEELKALTMETEKEQIPGTQGQTPKPQGKLKVE